MISQIKIRQHEELSHHEKEQDKTKMEVYLGRPLILG